MKTIFDTSVLVASCVKNHPKHNVARKWLEKSSKMEIEAYVASHSLIEAYSVLTRAPFQPKIGSAEAYLMLERNILSHVRQINLEADNYLEVLKKLSENKFVGGISYDAIILACAKKYKLQQLISANAKDFIKIIRGFQWDLEIIGI
ncbi:MAG: PIN domain-containing protein [Bacteroidota bacterium]